MVAAIRQIWEKAAIESWLYFLAFVFFGVYVLYSLRSRLRVIRFILSLDGPPTVPILGNASFVYDDQVLYKMSHLAYEQYGPVFRLWLSFYPCIVVLEPKDIQLVLGSTKNLNKIIYYKMLDNFIGKGLITSEVGIWTKHRKILQAAFHLQYLDKFTEAFARSSERLVKKLDRPTPHDYNVTSFINDSVYEILNEIVLGIKVSSTENPSGCNDNNSHRQHQLPFRKGQVFVPYRLTRPWLLIEWIYKLTNSGKSEQKHRDDLAEACRRIVREKRDEIVTRVQATTPPEINTLMDFMIEENRKNKDCFTDEDIVNECCTFMLAGQESVSTATALTLFLLANHPESLDKCTAEIEKIFGPFDRSRDELFQPKIHHFRSMKYLEMCIKETLRLYPSVPLFARTLGEDIQIGKRVVPAGCGVLLIPYSTHRLAHHFSDPHTFRPERFSPENSHKRHPYAYLPFSAGPRNCIGNKLAMLEIKCIVSAILRKFVLAPVPGKDKVHPKFRLTVRAKGGLWIRILPRTTINNNNNNNNNDNNQTNEDDETFATIDNGARDK